MNEVIFTRRRHLLVSAAAFMMTVLVFGPLSTATAGAASQELELEVSGSALHWDAVPGVDESRVSDAISGISYTTSGNSLRLTDLAHEGDLSVSVVAVTGEEPVAVGQVRGGVAELAAATPSSSGSTAHEGGEPTRQEGSAPTVQEGMALLASMRVSVAGVRAQFEMPSQLMSVINSRSLYRNDALVGTTTESTLTDRRAKPGASYGYTVVLTAPNWRSVKDVSLPFQAAPDECTAYPVPCTEPQGPAPAFEEGEGDDYVAGDQMSFTIPVTVPDLSSRRMLDASFSVQTNTRTADDARVWHNTSIEQRYVDAPQPPGYPDYWFGGDNPPSREAPAPRRVHRPA